MTRNLYPYMDLVWIAMNLFLFLEGLYARQHIVQEKTIFYLFVKLILYRTEVRPNYQIP